MIRRALPLAILAALGLSACGTDPNTMGSRDPAPRASAPQGQAIPYRAGSGVVQSVTAAPQASAGGSTPVTTTRAEPVTSAGSTAAGGQMQRLAIRMDDGRIQYVDMAGADIPAVGSRVQLTPDFQILRQ
jgi:hypothetical protein